MNYHNITKDDMINGEGLRVVLWVSGCLHRCVGCQNPETHDPNSGIPFDKQAEDELFEALNKDYIDGITFCGGSPLYEGNRPEVYRLVKKIRKELPNKTIWLYTGYTWEQILIQDQMYEDHEVNSPSALDIVKYCDVIVNGPYMEELRDTTLAFRGSSNQRIIDVKNTLKVIKFKPNRIVTLQ